MTHHSCSQGSTGWAASRKQAGGQQQAACAACSASHPADPFPCPTRSYGPFSVDGKPTTESNAAFDAALRQRNREWGYRDVADVGKLASAAGLALVERRDMPSNNFLLVFRKE